MIVVSNEKLNLKDEDLKIISYDDFFEEAFGEDNEGIDEEQYFINSKDVPEDVYSALIDYPEIFKFFSIDGESPEFIDEVEDWSDKIKTELDHNNSQVKNLDQVVSEIAEEMNINLDEEDEIPVSMPAAVPESSPAEIPD